MFPFKTPGASSGRSMNRVVLYAMLLPAGVVAGASLLPNDADRAAPSQPPPKPTGAQLDHGRALFAKHCASCHGPTGQGDGSAGRDLDPQPSNLRDPEVASRPDAHLFRQITRGRRPMPSFGRLLSDDDRWTLVAFVKSLGASNGGRSTR
jgi:mono/diheme cytochrome c family protein